MRAISISSKLLLGLAMAAGLSFAASAGNDDATFEEGDQNMSVGEATDNMVEDSKKVGDKAVELGQDAADEAEKAYDSTKEAVESATE